MLQENLQEIQNEQTQALHLPTTMGKDKNSKPTTHVQRRSLTLLSKHEYNS